MPFSVNVDYFTIVDSSNNQIEIKASGTCIGMKHDNFQLTCVLITIYYQDS